MSSKLERAIWCHSRAVGIDRFVLLCIAEHLNHGTGQAWPSFDRLAERCGLAESTVKRAVRTLELLGELKITPHGGPSVRADRRPNLYRITLTGCQRDTPSCGPRGVRETPTGVSQRPLNQEPQPRTEEQGLGLRPSPLPMAKLVHHLRAVPREAS